MTDTPILETQQPTPKTIAASTVVSPAMLVEIDTSAKTLAEARALVIDSGTMAQVAAESMNAVKKRITRMEELQSGILSPLTQAVERVKNLFAPGLANLKATEQWYKTALLEWQAKETKRIAAENTERERAARELRQKAEAEAAAARAKADAEAEATRKKAAEAEAARRKAEAEGDAKAAAKAAETAAKLTEKADALIENADAKSAEILVAAEAAAPPAVRQVAITGFSRRKNWKAFRADCMTDEGAKLALMRALFGLPADYAVVRRGLLAYVVIDDKALNQAAKSMEGNFDIPGFVARNVPVAAGSNR